ncbi:MAG: class I SAM-dependent methyltransferase [bacterium]|nr:class I SAM-dependent methyltransferase [bacterium]
MKQTVKKLLPSWVLDRWMKLQYQRKSSVYQNRDINQVFTEIYEKNRWKDNETVSGQGSTLTQMQPIIPAIEEAFATLEVKTILDIPCGDFNWMQHVNLEGIDYRGADIVVDLINQNQAKFGAENIHFSHLDITKDQLPKSDLILNKDCFIHFSYAHIYQALQRIKESESRYLMGTTYTNQTLNFDITTGDWRPLNFQIGPFYFPKPILSITEYCEQHLTKAQKGKSLVIWEIQKIKLSENGYE